MESFNSSIRLEMVRRGINFTFHTYLGSHIYEELIFKFCPIVRQDFDGSSKFGVYLIYLCLDHLTSSFGLQGDTEHSSC